MCGLATGIATGFFTVEIATFFSKNTEKEIFVDKNQKLQEDGFCYCQGVQERDKINIDYLTKKAQRNLEDGQSFVDISSVQDVDVQEKIMKELFVKVKNIKPEKNQYDDNIWITSDIHGDMVMLIQGLLKSGIIFWNGETKIEEYHAYKNKTLKIVYPDVKINSNFKGIYINLGDIVNKQPFGIASLYLLHDIYNKTKEKNGKNNRVKIIIGNHEYADMLIEKFSDYSPYKQTLLKFIDMFDVYYEQNGISFTHAPLPDSIKPKNNVETKQLKNQILNDKDYKVKHILWGVDKIGNIKTAIATARPDRISKCNVSGHTHGKIDFGYNKRNDVLNIATDRFNDDKTKRGIIFRINIAKKEVYSYIEQNGEIMEKKLNKNLFDCN